jgi:hypothetical protein
MEQNQALDQMFAEYLSENPKFQAMYSMMQQMKASRESNFEAKTPSMEARELAAYKAKLAKASAKIRQLTLEVEELQEELSESDRFEEEIANALGCCSFCWGEDPTCRACRGKGKPGTFEPDQALFEQYVVPILRRQRVNLQ